MSLKKSLDETMEAMSDRERSIALQNRFPYLFSKAYVYLRMGPERYRKQDFFRQPAADLTEEELSLVESGCKQVLTGKGLTPEEPFKGLGISGFYNLFRLFHFELIRQSATPTRNGMMDEMRMEHTVEGGEVVYYNLVEYSMP